MKRRKKFKTASLFCGAGGESAGKEAAFRELGIDTLFQEGIALNHWVLAIDAHKMNFPGINAYESDITKVTAHTFGLKEIDLLWASPSCVHFSNARAGLPKSEQQRSHADEVLDRWLRLANVRVFLMENVKEFATFGPLDAKGHPIKKHKGKFFRRFLNDLRSLGYQVEFRILCAADYGDATSRRRLFLQAVKDGKGISWPKPTHAQPGSKNDDGTLPLWRTAAEIINWSLHGQSIFYRKKPLVANSLRRIRHGLKNIGLRHLFDETMSTEDFLAEYHAGDDGDKRVRRVNEPIPTIDTSNRFRLVRPFVSKTFGKGCTHPTSPVEKPVPTITTVDHNQLIEPFCVKYQGTGNSESLSEPLSTVTAGGVKQGLVEPFLTEYYGASNSVSLGKPMNAITAGAQKHSLTQPFFIKYYGTAQSCGVNDEPIPTITTKDRMNLVEIVLEKEGGFDNLEIVRCLDDIDNLKLEKPFIVEVHGDRRLVDIKTRMLSPRELADAMGFPHWYRFLNADGTDMSHETIVKMVGNACPVNTVKELIKTVVRARPEVYGECHEVA